MTLHVALTHRTAYQYDRVIGMAPQVIRLRPAPHCRTPILSYSLKIEPKVHFINWQQDPFANYCARIVLPEKCDQLRRDGRPRGRHGGHQSVRLLRRGRGQGLAVRLRARPQGESSGPISSRCPAGPRLKAFLATLPREKAVTIDFLCDLNRKLHAEVSYCIRMEPGIQTPEETLQKALRLVPRLRLAAGADPAPHRLRGALRVGLPDPVAPRREAARRARRAPKPTLPTCTPGPRSTCRARAGSASIRRRACLAGEGHIPLAATPQPSSAAPISGAHEPAEVTFDFDMHVERIRETPRVTLPYSEEQWAEHSRRRRRRRCAPRQRRRAPQHGRRADVRLHRRHGGRRVEDRGRRPDQAALRRGPRAPAAAALRAGRPSALRPGQMVSGRAAAAMGVRHLLAPRRRAAVGQPRPHRAREDRDRRRRSPTPAS